MVFKLKINFTSPVEIQDNNLLPLHKRIVIVMTPFPEDQVAGGYDNKKVDPYWSATYMGTTYSNAWSFMPSSLELNKGIFPNVNGYFIVSVPDELNLMHSLTKTYKFIYVEDAGHQKLKRLGVASNTTSSTNVTINGVMTIEGDTLKSTIPPEILSAEVSDENPKDIIFKFTNGRTLEMNDVQKEAFKGVITTNNVSDYGAYSLGTVSVDNENKSVKVSGDGIGKLTRNSIISLNTDEDDVGQDEFGFKLVKSTNFPTFKNNIKNPKLFGFITPSDNKNGNIVLRLSKDEGNTFISNINYKNNAEEFGTSPHSQISLSDGSNLPDNFPSFGLINVENSDQTDNNFKNEVSSHFNEQVVKLRSNRFARSDLNYTVSYSPQADFQNSGIFETKGGEDHHAVLQQPNASNMTNLLQPIVIDTVSEVKVVYDSTKTTNGWSSNTALGEEGDNYSSYAAYYYVDITFKNANTNQPVLITAKYNGDVDEAGNINCQYSGGHEIHHGLILNYNNQEIPEEITQTTIRDNNGNVVDLRSGANGSILRIEFPAGSNNGGTKNAYNTETNNPTSYGFTDPTKSLILTFSDKQKKNWQGDQIENEFYFLNVMDSDGNVCLPFTKNVLFPNNWGMDKFGELPKIASAAVNVTHTDVGGWSNKKLTLTFNQDIYDTPNVPIILNKDLELELSNLVTLSQKTISGKTITYVVNDINRNDGLSVSYDKPIGVGLNNGIYDNILYNWFGFEIYSFPNFPVINNLPVIPSIKNIVFTNIVDGETSFGATLTWELTNDRLLGLEQNPVDSSKISEYTIETASTFNATTWTTVNGNLQDPNISFIAEGLNYNEDVFVRIKAKTYDFGEYTVSGKIIRFKISGFTASMSPSYQSNKIINFSWNIPQNANYPDGYPKYRIQRAYYDINDNNEPTIPNPITKGTYQTIIDDLTASGNTAFTQSNYGKNVIFKLSIKSDSNSDYSEVGESNPILTYPEGPTISSVSDPNENNIIEIKWTRFEGDFKAENVGGEGGGTYLANANGFDQNNWFENGGEFQGIDYELQYSTNSDMSNPIKLDLKAGDVNFKHGVGGSEAEAKYNFDISSFIGTTTFYFRVRVTNNQNGPGGDSATLGGFSDWGAIFSKTITQQLTFPEISFLDASQEDQLPIRIGDATQDMTQSDTRDNLSTHEIYWSYKPTTGDQANNWGGKLYQALEGLDIPVGEMPIENDGPDLVELYGGGENIPDAVDPGVAWLKMPVFWLSDSGEANPDVTSFPNYQSTGGFPWYNAATGTFNNLITTEDGPDETEDMTTPLELKFIMINKNQGVAAGTSDVKDHTIVYNVPTITGLSFQELGLEIMISWNGISNITKYEWYSQGVGTSTNPNEITPDAQGILEPSLVGYAAAEIGGGEFGVRGVYVDGDNVFEGEYAKIELPSPPALSITLSFQLASGDTLENATNTTNGVIVAGKLSSGANFGSSILPLPNALGQIDANNNYIRYAYSYSNSQFTLTVNASAGLSTFQSLKFTNSGNDELTYDYADATSSNTQIEWIFNNANEGGIPEGLEDFWENGYGENITLEVITA